MNERNEIERLVIDYSMAVDLNLNRKDTRKALMSAIDRVLAERDEYRRAAEECSRHCIAVTDELRDYRKAVREYVKARDAILDYTHSYLESGGNPLLMPSKWHQLDKARQSAFEDLRAALAQPEEKP